MSVSNCLISLVRQFAFRLGVIGFSSGHPWQHITSVTQSHPTLTHVCDTCVFNPIVKCFFLISLMLWFRPIFLPSATGPPLNHVLRQLVVMGSEDWTALELVGRGAPDQAGQPNRIMSEENRKCICMWRKEKEIKDEPSKRICLTLGGAIPSVYALKDFFFPSRPHRINLTEARWAQIYHTPLQIWHNARLGMCEREIKKEK